jgi:biotin operon repressor
MKSKVLNIMKQNSYRTINGKDIRYALEQQGINLSPLALRKLIQSLRNEGHPISANHIGYKYHDLTQPIERKAMSEYIESRRREIRQESITINILSNLLMDATNTHTKKYNDFAEAVFNSDYKETLIDC